MSKKLSILALTLVFILSMFSLNAYAYTNSNWMGSIDGTKSLTKLSIPGTHDSGALYEPISGTAKCQSLTIAQQLTAGVRYLDIRCRHYYNEFPIHHSAIFQNIYFDDVINDCYTFLNNNPTECIVMSIKEEYTASGNTRTFEQTFDSYISANKSKWYLGSSIPTLDQARGKIVLLRRFAASTLPKGIDATGWQDDATFTLTTGGTHVKIQDEYVVYYRSTKWDLIEDTLDEAKAYNSTWLYINFASGHHPVLGIKYVSDDINPKIDTYFTTNTSGRFGVLVMDFATSTRCLKIIKTNTFK